MKAIVSTITATMLVDDERPAMDHAERCHVERALIDAVRMALVETFVCNEPDVLSTDVRNITVAFSGHVTE